MANENGNDPAPAGWMSDVQRAIALILIGTFALLCLFSTITSLFFKEPPAALVDMVKTLQAALVNMSLIALGFFFGNTMAKMAQDAGQQKVVDKLTSTAPPNGGPVAPLAAPTVVVVAWWSLLTDAERTAITAASPTDPKAASFMAAAQTGKASVDDLNDLVAKGLLTQDRANAIQA